MLRGGCVMRADDPRGGWRPSGAEFSCWVNPQYRANMEFDVWDQVTVEQLSHFPVTDSVFISNRGDPAKPTF